MELREYIRIVRRRGWIVVVMAVLVAAAAYAFSKAQVPIYEASVRLTVRPARADWGLQQTVSALLRSLAGDITTHTFMQEIINREQLDTTTDDLLNGKTIFAKDEASDFTITVVARDPDWRIATRMVNSIADKFVEDIKTYNATQDKTDQIGVNIRDHARSAGIYSPKTTINVAAGGVLGALIGTLVVFVMEWLEAGAVRYLEDMDRLGLPALGAIPAETRRRHS